MSAPCRTLPVMPQLPPVDVRLLDAVADAWERGWRPADLVHAVGRVAPTLAGLAAAVAVSSVETLGAGRAVPAEWWTQVSEVRRRVQGETRPGDVRDLLLQVRLLPPIPQLGQTPSRWPVGRTADPGSAPDGPGGGDGAGDAAARALRRIRALLAKAESTDFPEEAEALTAKAQELMAQHAIDAVLLDADRGAAPAAGVAERRLHLEPPYLDAKMHLVSAVAGANGVRAAWFGSLGIAVLVGTPADLDAVELLTTSLLVQAGRAMQAAGRSGEGHSRSRGFRRAFLLAYAVRVGERLETARRSRDGRGSRIGVDPRHRPGAGAARSGSRGHAGVRRPLPAPADPADDLRRPLGVALRPRGRRLRRPEAQAPPVVLTARHPHSLPTAGRPPPPRPGGSGAAVRRGQKGADSSPGRVGRPQTRSRSRARRLVGGESAPVDAVGARVLVGDCRVGGGCGGCAAVVGADAGRDGGDGGAAGQGPLQAAVGGAGQAPAGGLVGQPVVVLAEGLEVGVRGRAVRIGHPVVEVAAAGGHAAAGEAAAAVAEPDEAVQRVGGAVVVGLVGWGQAVAGAGGVSAVRCCR